MLLLLVLLFLLLLLLLLLVALQLQHLTHAVAASWPAAVKLLPAVYEDHW